MLATSPADRAPAAEDLTFHPDSIAKPALDLQLRRDASDLLTSARCPVCRGAAGRAHDVPRAAVFVPV
jgi:hypothetical protein